MATRRQIICPFCPDDDAAKAIPPAWSTDYAMAWFNSTHLAEHAEQMIACVPCVASMWSARPHRPCFEPDCYCDCSRTTTTMTERTAHADD